MNNKILIPLAAIATGIFLLILFYLIRCLFHRSKNPHQQQQQQQQSIQRASSLQNGISKLQQRETIFNNKRRSSYYVLRRGISSKPLFNWSDNPSLITDAVENGWSRFAFSNYVSSSSTKSILSYCGSTGDGKDKEIVETSWEVCEGSSDFMQIIRLNSGSKKSINSSLTACSVIKSALPLPGPVVANSFPFPQEAYFEITILSTYEISEMDKGDSEKVKLIHAGENVSSESLVHVTNNNSNNNSNSNNNNNGMNIKDVVVKAEELKSRNGGKDVVEGKMEISVVLSVGLVGGGSLPLKLPGSYPGSIGFNSDGSVYLEGIKLKTELEYEEWGKADKVIGCGYNPNQKKVYFTVDGKLVREIYCTTEEFETPLYPILAANGSLTVLVNFGQSVFKYTQANLHRTPNPCFVGQSANSPIIGYEDSRELFSMGRIDSHWLDRSTKRNAQYFGSVNRGMSDYDESSDGDLFEIVLDNNSRGRSPSMHY